MPCLLLPKQNRELGSGGGWAEPNVSLRPSPGLDSVWPGFCLPSQLGAQPMRRECGGSANGRARLSGRQAGRLCMTRASPTNPCLTRWSTPKTNCHQLLHCKLAQSNTGQKFAASSHKFCLIILRLSQADDIYSLFQLGEKILKF